MEAKDIAKELLSRMPKGNARIFCTNKINENPYTSGYWERVRWWLDFTDRLC